MSYSKYIILLLILSLSFNILFIIKISQEGITGSHISNNQYKLINPVEQYQNSDHEGTGVIHYTLLKETLERKIEYYNATGKVGIFIQDAKTGALMGINENKIFTSGSLVKVPVMMAILKKVDRKELALKDQIEIIYEDIDHFYSEYKAPPFYKPSIGKKKLSTLLKEMVTYSDNTPFYALLRQLYVKDLNSAFIHVGMDVDLKKTELFFTPRETTRFFRSLYYSTFLSPASSELALDLMTDTGEESLISKGINPEIEVAHKFGMVYEEGKLFEKKALHDCGIVYHPQNPYFICIMTKELSTEKGYELIPILSKEIFDFVENSSKQIDLN